MKYYLLDENKNLVEGFDKEGFLALLEQAIEEGSLENIDENSAVASKLKSVLNGTTHHIEFVTQAQYNQLEAEGQLVANTYYFITDDTTLEGLENELNNLVIRMTNVEESINSILGGTIAVGKATKLDGGWQSQAMSTYPTLANGSTYLIRWESDDHTDVINFGAVYFDRYTRASCNQRNGNSYCLESNSAGEVMLYLGSNAITSGTLYYKEIL